MFQMSDLNSTQISPFGKVMATQNATQNDTEQLSMFDRLKNLPKHYDNSSNDILSKLNGLNITLPDGNIGININDIINKNVDENERDFEIRKRLTKNLLNIELINTKEKINTITAINIGNMIMKKCKLGLKYDVDTESVITYFMNKI
jgi:hypothetical protein